MGHVESRLTACIAMASHPLSGLVEVRYGRRKASQYEIGRDNSMIGAGLATTRGAADHPTAAGKFGDE